MTQNTPPPPDIIAAIGEPSRPPSRFTDAEIGWMMKCRARELIDAGEIKTEQDALERFKARAQWIANSDYLDDSTRLYWLKFEQKFFYSARKYLAELRDLQSSFKK